MPATGTGSEDIKVERCDPPIRSARPRCGNRYEIGAPVSAPLIMRKSAGVRTVQEDFQREVTPNGSNKMRRWPKKSVGSIQGRRLEGYSSTMLVWGTSKEL